MIKLQALLTTLTLTVFTSSCGDSKVSKNKITSLPAQTLVEYPYTYIDTKKEMRKNDNSYNEMLLYTCGNKPSFDTLQMFCSNRKKEFTGGVFHIVVFFDNKENAMFPNNPVTGGYIEEIPSKHIKAIYTYNKANGYSKLDFYDKNAWQSAAKTTEIN